MFYLVKSNSLVKNIKKLPEPIVEHILSFCNYDKIEHDLEVSLKNFGKAFCFWSMFIIIAYFTGSLVTGYHFSVSIILLNILIGWLIVSFIFVLFSVLQVLIFEEKNCIVNTSITPLLPT